MVHHKTVFRVLSTFLQLWRLTTEEISTDFTEDTTAFMSLQVLFNLESGCIPQWVNWINLTFSLLRPTRQTTVASRNQVPHRRRWACNTNEIKSPWKFRRKKLRPSTLGWNRIVQWPSWRCVFNTVSWCLPPDLAIDINTLHFRTANCRP